jgi:hypothetical protein
VPDGLAHIWAHFLAMHDCRTYGPFIGEAIVYNPISYREIEAYNRLTGAELAAWQIDLIAALDRVFRSGKLRPFGTGGEAAVGTARDMFRQLAKARNKKGGASG